MEKSNVEEALNLLGQFPNLEDRVAELETYFPRKTLSGILLLSSLFKGYEVTELTAIDIAVHCSPIQDNVIIHLLERELPILAIFNKAESILDSSKYILIAREKLTYKEAVYAEQCVNELQRRIWEGSPKQRALNEIIKSFEDDNEF